METRSARKRQLAIGSAGQFPSTPNGIHSNSTTNGVVVETQEMKQAALVKAIESTGALLLYLLSSSLIIILNKRLMVDDGFKFPLALTGMSQVAGALAGAHPPHHPVTHAPLGDLPACLRQIVMPPSQDLCFIRQCVPGKVPHQCMLDFSQERPQCRSD